MLMTMMMMADIGNVRDVGGGVELCGSNNDNEDGYGDCDDCDGAAASDGVGGVGDSKRCAG